MLLDATLHVRLARLLLLLLETDMPEAVVRLAANSIALPCSAVPTDLKKRERMTCFAQLKEQLNRLLRVRGKAYLPEVQLRTPLDYVGCGERLGKLLSLNSFLSGRERVSEKERKAEKKMRDAAQPCALPPLSSGYGLLLILG